MIGVSFAGLPQSVTYVIEELGNHNSFTVLRIWISIKVMEQPRH